MDLKKQEILVEASSDRILCISEVVSSNRFGFSNFLTRDPFQVFWILRAAENLCCICWSGEELFMFCCLKKEKKKTPLLFYFDTERNRVWKYILQIRQNLKKARKKIKKKYKDDSFQFLFTISSISTFICCCFQFYFFFIQSSRCNNFQVTSSHLQF